MAEIFYGQWNRRGDVYWSPVMGARLGSGATAKMPLGSMTSWASYNPAPFYHIPDRLNIRDGMHYEVQSGSGTDLDPEIPPWSTGINTCTFHIYYDGLLPFQPHPNDEPYAIGFETEPGPLSMWTEGNVTYMFDFRCQQYGYEPEYFAWYYGGGRELFNLYNSISPVGPVLSGEMSVLIGTIGHGITNAPGNPFGYTTIVGHVGSVVVFENEAYGDFENEHTRFMSGYSHLVYPTLGNTPVNGVAIETIPVGERLFTVPLPAAQTLPLYGQCRIPAAQFLSHPTGQYPTEGPTGHQVWSTFGEIKVEAAYGNAHQQPWRWLLAQPVLQEVIPPLRMRKRDDSLGVGTGGARFQGAAGEPSSSRQEANAPRIKQGYF